MKILLKSRVVMLINQLYKKYILKVKFHLQIKTCEINGMPRRTLNSEFRYKRKWSALVDYYLINVSNYIAEPSMERISQIT